MTANEIKERDASRRERIRALLNLARNEGANPNEAEIARGLAERMMAAAGLSESDIASDGSIDPVETFGESGDTVKTRGWVGILAVAVAKVVGCWVYNKPVKGKNDVTNMVIRWVGTAQQRDTAAQLFAWMMEQIDRLAKAAVSTARASGNTKAWLGAYRRGMASAISMQAERLAKARDIVAASTPPASSEALVRVSKLADALAVFKKSIGIKRDYAPTSYQTSAGGAYRAGKNDGGSVRLQRDVAGAVQKRLGSGS